MRFTTDGYSLDEHIPLYLRNEFYKNEHPENTYATTNGYAPYGFSTYGLMLYAPLWALRGGGFYTIDAYKNSSLVAGATWQKYGRYFDGTNDWIDFGNPAFTANQAGTVLLWLKNEGVATTEYHSLTFCKTDTGAIDEYKLEFKNNDFRLEVHDNSVNTHNLTSTGDAFPIDTTFLLGWSSDGSVNYLHKNGVNVALTENVGTADGVWFGDLTTDANKIMLGILARSSGYINDFEGRVGDLWVYNRALPAAEQLEMHKATNWRTLS